MLCSFTYDNFLKPPIRKYPSHHLPYTPFQSLPYRILPVSTSLQVFRCPHTSNSVKQYLRTETEYKPVIMAIFS